MRNRVEDRAIKQRVLLLLAIGTTLAQPAVAQSPGGGERVRVAGTVEKLEGDWLTVDIAGGRTQAVLLSPDAKIYGVEKRVFGDIKPGDFVASGACAGPTAKFTPLSCGFSRNRCGGSARVSGLGTLNPKAAVAFPRVIGGPGSDFTP